MERLKSIIKVLSEKFYGQIESQGYLDSGHNGPYNDEETPLRNTAHWLITFSYLYDLTHQENYLDATKSCGEYLISDKARPMQTTFHCRKNPEKDFCNGLIGQAWVIEALVEAYKITKENRYIDIATEVFLLHPFDKSLGLWKRVNVDGSYNGFDMTFNHQLWFVAAGALIYEQTKNKKIKNQIDCFFDNIDNLLKIKSNGRIKHSIRLYNSKKNIIKNSLRKINKIKNQFSNKVSMEYIENGYHIFNLYAFALIKNSGLNYKFFNSHKFNKIINYAFSDYLFQELEKNNYKSDATRLRNVDNDLEVNRYGYAYNAPGFELPFVYEVFKKEFVLDKSYADKAIDNQIKYTYNNNTNKFDRNTEDPETLTARVYEITRYIRLKKQNIKTS